MKIATFNINNVNKRLGNLVAWLRMARPDVVCLQELKAEDSAFPAAALREAGYGAVWKGQKSWNGVAILARGGEPVLTRGALPGDVHDRQARYIEAAVQGVLFGCLYLPNGNPQPGPKFDYKLAWFVAADRSRSRPDGDRAADRPRRRLQRGPDRCGHLPVEVLGEERFGAAGKPRGVPPLAGPGLDGWHQGREPRLRGSTRSGIPCGTAGPETRACGWITCC